MKTKRIRVAEFKRGMVPMVNGKPAYTVESDAYLVEDGKVVVDVRYRDGGNGRRVWEDPNIEIEVEDE